MSNRTPLSNRMRKDVGIKLLDINEQPLGYAQAKKRKRMMELEEQQKKVAEAQAVAAAAASTATTTAETSTTPEYAQGLTSINPPATPITPVAPIQSYTTPTPPSAVSPVTTPQTRMFVLYKTSFCRIENNQFFLIQLPHQVHLRLRVQLYLFRHRRLLRQWKVHLSEYKQSDQLKRLHKFAYRLPHNLLMQQQTQERVYL